MQAIRIWELIEFLAAVTGGAIGWFLGGIDGLVIGLFALTVIDYLSGFACALIAKKNLSSAIGFKGIVKKVFIFVLVIIGNFFDDYILGSGEMLRTGVIFWFIANEGLSIVENAAILGVPIPDMLRDALEQVKKKGDKK